MTDMQDYARQGTRALGCVLGSARQNGFNFDDRDAATLREAVAVLSAVVQLDYLRGRFGVDA